MRHRRHWLADSLVRIAAGRLRHRHPDWANAMISEHESLTDHQDQLGWAFGSLRASFSLEDGYFPAVLMLAVAAMTAYEWSADESLKTLGIMTGLGLVLGLLWPRRFLISGVAVGMVVAVVSGFETMTGIRPAYELYHHTVLHDLRWMVLIAPALVSSAFGRQIGLKLPI